MIKRPAALHAVGALHLCAGATKTCVVRPAIKEYFFTFNVSAHETMLIFQKKCPHCGETIDVRALRKVPRVLRPRWYQTTPAPHTACPRCGGFVVSTIANSPLLIVPCGLGIAFTLASLFFPEVESIFRAIPGAPYSLALVVLCFAWAAQRRAVLVRETFPKGSTNAL